MALKLFVTDCEDNQKFSYLLAVIGDVDAVLFRAPQVVATIPAEIWLVLRRWIYPFWM